LQTTIFCISHEIPLLLKFCNRIGIMKDGEMVEILTLNRNRKKVTIENTPINPYTKSLFQAFELDSLI
ncbi:MAG: hypothetical protein N3B14_09840, partial [Thermoleophilia bacterium]|nr:hypothetical protein [Thermoleophilia bacterium]